MNRWALTGLVAMLAVAMFGCERKGNPEETTYDPKVDAPPSPMTKVESDQGILEDQTAISRLYESARSGAGDGTGTLRPSGTSPAAPTPPSSPTPTPDDTGSPTGAPAEAPSGEGVTPPAMTPTPPDVAPEPGAIPAPTPPVVTPTPTPVASTPVDAATETAVKAALGKLVEASKPAQLQQLLGLFDEPDAGAMRYHMGNQGEIADTLKNAEQALKTQMGYDLTPMTKEMKIDFPFTRFDDMKPAEVKVVKVGEEIVAQLPTGKSVKFTNIDGAWKAGIPAAMQAMIDAYDSYCGNVRNFGNDIINSVQDSSLTKENVDARVQSSANAVLAAIAKFKQAKEAAMGPDSPAPAVSPTPSPTPSAAPTPKPTGPVGAAPKAPSTPIQVPEPPPALPFMP